MFYTLLIFILTFICYLLLLQNIKFCPQRPCVVIASTARYILLCYLNHLEVWRLGETKCTNPGQSQVLLPLSKDVIKLIHLESYGNKQIRCASISSDGCWIAYSTDEVFRLYALDVVSNIIFIVKKLLQLSLVVITCVLIYKLYKYLFNTFYSLLYWSVLWLFRLYRDIFRLCNFLNIFSTTYKTYTWTQYLDKKHHMFYNVTTLSKL